MFKWESPSQEQRELILLTWNWRSHSHSWQCSEEPAFGICCSHPVEGFILPIKYFTRQRKQLQSTLLHPLWWFSSARGCLLGPSEQEAPSKDKKKQLFEIWRKGYRENKIYRGMFHPAGVRSALWIGSTTHGSQWQGRETEGQAGGHSTSQRWHIALGCQEPLPEILPQDHRVSSQTAMPSPSSTTKLLREHIFPIIQESCGKLPFACMFAYVHVHVSSQLHPSNFIVTYTMALPLS